MVMDKKSKLGKLKMPMPKKQEEMDMGDEGMDYDTMEAHEKDESPEEEPSEAQEMEAKEEEMGLEKEPSELAKIPDEELMAEIQKRGLMNKMEEKESEQGDQDLDLGM